MKTNLLLLFLLGWAGMVFGQEDEIKKDGNYYFNYPISAQLINLKSTDNTDKTAVESIIVGKKINVKVKKVEAGQVTFEFTDKLGLGLDERRTYSLST